MNPSVPTDPSQMLPANLLRGGQTTPQQLFQQNPLSQNMSPSAMGAQPGLQTPPPPGSQAVNQSTMPPQGAQPGSVQPQPSTDVQPLSESQMILDALVKRLETHSKIGSKTTDTVLKFIESMMPQPPENGNEPIPSAPTA